MAYTKPMVQVYQELANPGGAAAISPDLPACIIGELNNIISINFNDSVALAGSLASTITTWPTTSNVSVNSDTDFPGQVITDTSVTAVMGNCLIHNYSEAGVSSAGGVLTIATNLIGTSGLNAYNDALPYDSTSNHINLGDAVVLTSATASLTIRTFVTDVEVGGTVNTFAVADQTVSDQADWVVEVYHKYSQHTPAAVGWDSTLNALVIGSATTHSNGTFPYTQVTGEQYQYAVEQEIRGSGDDLDIYIGYTAARQDTINSILTINNTTDLQNLLGVIHPDNPLAFGVSIALANSGGAPVYAIATDQSLDEVAAHSVAAQLAEGQNLYWMVPLTTAPAVQAIWDSHVRAMSLPASGQWRVTLLNQAILSEINILGVPGTADGADPDVIPDGLIQGTVTAAGALATITITDGSQVGTVTSGDNFHVYVADNPYVDYVVSDAGGFLIIVEDPSGALTQGTVVDFYVGRTATKQDQAQNVADQGTTWAHNRVMNFPGDVFVPVDGLDTQVPGYFLMCGLAGQGSGFPAQTGFTNVTIAGISNLVHSNFYFSQAQLDLMAEFGTVLYVQESQGTTPYNRHAITTDVSVLEYREILKVKNWDYLSYYFKSILEPFIGTWNITPDTIRTIEQTIISAAERLLVQKLPKVGPPMLSYDSLTVTQNATSADALDVRMNIAIVSPNNYTNVYLVI